ncbi:unnamed protein product [Schistocephalus solidus]|uniref:Uncharacterized protein n=1 Tax=Schistocephalus solidus TaxID=70667 RepID=A0A183T2K9_SCHSO|nr:unnamed protein product [Schistocephalus solidus]
MVSQERLATKYTECVCAPVCLPEPVAIPAVSKTRPPEAASYCLSLTSTPHSTHPSASSPRPGGGVASVVRVVSGCVRRGHDGMPLSHYIGAVAVFKSPPPYLTAARRPLSCCDTDRLACPGVTATHPLTHTRMSSSPPSPVRDTGPRLCVRGKDSREWAPPPYDRRTDRRARACFLIGVRTVCPARTAAAPPYARAVRM